LIKERNVTTWPETWSGWGSQIIQVVGTPGAWLYEGLAGIQPDPQQPGFKHFTIRPGIVNSVDWVECTYQSPYGEIVSNWWRKAGKLEMDVTVPTNTTATVFVPTTQPQTVTESGSPAGEARGVARLGNEDGCAVFRIESGQYVFETSIETQE
jgi:alpha-L-rhamnosidase